MKVETRAAAGRSSKTARSPLPTQQLKPGSDNVQNSTSSLPSHAKGKKKERSDHSTESVKHENDQLPKAEDADSVGTKVNDVQTEVFKITRKGGLTFDTVEKLVSLISLDRTEKKIDWAGRFMLVTTIAATERYDCLYRFVQLRGVTILDEWLQETQKGKNGDGSSPKGTDKSTEELLLAMLRALDKLPVNLTALQTCNIGKSVNHLRSHKNVDIQKRARTLIETWKKRVDDEISKFAGPAQAVTWVGKPGCADTGSKHSGSSDLTMTNFTTQTPDSKALHVKLEHVDFMTMSDPLKVQSAQEASSVVTSKATISRTHSATNESPLPAAKGEKSSTSSLSNSLSSDDDHAKTMTTSWKEDGRSLAAGSMSICKASGGPTNQMSQGGFLGSTALCAQKEDNIDIANSQRLVVRHPNLGCSPVRSTSRSSFEEQATTGSRVSSPSLSAKNDHNDCKAKLRSNSSQSHIPADASAEHSSDVKGTLHHVKVDGSPSVVLNDGHGTTAEGTGKATDAPKYSCLSSGVERQPSSKRRTRNSFGSTNNLVDSSAKHPQAGASLSAADDGGMNLLASVAAGEISSSKLLAQSCSPRISAIAEPSASKSTVHNHVKSNGTACHDSQRHEKKEEQLQRNESQRAGGNFSSDNKMEGTQDDESSMPSERTPVPSTHRNAGSCMQPAGSSAENVGRSCSLYGASTKELDCKSPMRSPSAKLTYHTGLVSQKIGDASNSNDNPASNGALTKLTFDRSLHCPTDNAQGVPNLSKQPRLVISNNTDILDKSGKNCKASMNFDRRPSKNFGDDSNRKIAPPTVIGRSEREEKERAKLSPSGAEQDGSAATSTDNATEVEENGGSQVCPPVMAKQETSDSLLTKGSEDCLKPSSSKGSADYTGRREELASSAEASSLTADAETDGAAKVEFDLNEGFIGDDGHQSEPPTADDPVYSSTICVPGLSLFLSPSQQGAIMASSQRAGDFTSPGNLLKMKTEPGWKGSAATSAFRPAEPRKIFEMPLSTSDTPSSGSSGKIGQVPRGFDLNVPCEGAAGDIVYESTAHTTRSKASTSCTNGFDLDLNRVDKGTENTEFLTSRSHRFGAVVKLESPALRGFDLNGPGVPGVDEANVGHSARSHIVKNTNGLPFLTPSAGPRMNGPEVGQISSMFPPASSYSSVAMTSFLPERGELARHSAASNGAERAMGSVSGNGTFGGNIYRPMFSSSPTMAISPAAASYAGFPFGSNFPHAPTYVDSSPRPPAWYPAFPQHLVGPTGAVSSNHHARPYFFSLPEGGSNSGAGTSQKWTNHSLDLNSGPRSTDVEAKDDKVLPPPRQVLVASSHASLEEQARMYQALGASTKRKEPEGGWGAERSPYKQFPWQ